MIIHLNSHHDFGSGFNVFTLGFLNIVHSCIAKVIFPPVRWRTTRTASSGSGPCIPTTACSATYFTWWSMGTTSRKTNPWTQRRFALSPHAIAWPTRRNAHCQTLKICLLSWGRHVCCSAGFLTFNLHTWFIPHKVLTPLDRKEHAFPAYHPRLGARQGFKDIHRAQVHQVATAFMNKSSGSVHENVQGYDDAPLRKDCKHQIDMAKTLLFAEKHIPCFLSLNELTKISN